VRLLLDTHALLWWDEGDKLDRQARRAIEAAAEVFVSAVSAWEIAIKTALGRLAPVRTVAEAIEECGFQELPVTVRHAAQVARLPLHHRDPFDRLLIAQAKVEQLTVVTRNPAFRRYRVRTIPA
jgi:PIN domain nuclease of toxin-antitoxin system